MSLNTQEVTVTTAANHAPTGSLKYFGLAVEGWKLAISTADIKDLDGIDKSTITYQWRVDGVDIEGANKAYFNLTQAQVGKKMSVVVTYIDGNGKLETITSALTSKVENINDKAVGQVSIDGSFSEDSYLIGNHTIVDQDGFGSITYKFFADGQLIDNAGGDKLLLTQALVGKEISMVATFTDAFGNKTDFTSTNTGKVSNVNDAPVGDLNIVGDLEQGSTLSADIQFTDEDGFDASSVQYTWFANGVAIEGATSASLKLTQAEVNKKISVTANYTDNFGAQETVTSAVSADKVANINDAPTGNVSIEVRGTNKPFAQNETLKAVVNLSDIDGMTSVKSYSYTWLADGEIIKTNSTGTLKLSQAEVGKKISVVVQYVDDLFSTNSFTSSETVVIKDVNDLHTGKAYVSGSGLVGTELVATNDIQDIDGVGAITYIWRANGVNLLDANKKPITGDKLFISADLAGKKITATATYTDLQNHYEQAGSNAIVATAETVAAAPQATLISHAADIIDPVKVVGVHSDIALF